MTSAPYLGEAFEGEDWGPSDEEGLARIITRTPAADGWDDVPHTETIPDPPDIEIHPELTERDKAWLSHIRVNPPQEPEHEYEGGACRHCGRAE